MSEYEAAVAVKEADKDISEKKEAVKEADNEISQVDESASARQWARVFERRCKAGDTAGVGKEVSAILKFLDVAGSDNTGDIAFALANVLSFYCPATAEKFAPLDQAPSQGTGLVTKWFSNRGFGFIKSDDTSEDLFAHMTEIQGKFNALLIGKTVSYTRAFNSKRGNFQATKVSGEACVRAKMNARPRGICFDFQKGTCTRGSACRFSHTRGRGRGRGRGHRGGRGRGYSRGYNMNGYPYSYGTAAMYMPYGGGYGMNYGAYDGVYGNYLMTGYNGAGYGNYGGYPYGNGQQQQQQQQQPYSQGNLYSPPAEDSPVPSAATAGSSGDAPATPTNGGNGTQSTHDTPPPPPPDEGYDFSNVAPSF